MSDIFNLSLKEFLRTIRKSWITILIFAIIGLITALVYLQFVPNSYLATAQVQLSQIRGANYEWSNLEDPNLLLARMKSPTSFSDKSLVACQYASRFEMVKNVQLSLVKALPPSVEISVKNLSPTLSISCAEAVVEDLKNYEEDLVGKKIVQYKEWLEYYSAKMNKLKKDYRLLPAYQGAIASVDEIAARDQIKWITEKVLSLDGVIRFADEGAGRLLSPIFVSPKPVSPKSLIIEIAGFLLGLMIGLFVGIFRNVYLPRLKAL